MMLLATLLASLAAFTAFSEAGLVQRQNSCPAINSTFYIQAKTLGAANGMYGTINPQGPYPTFTTTNISQSTPYFLDSAGHIHAATEPTKYQLWISLNYDLSNSSNTAEEFQYVSIYQPNKDMHALKCALVPTASGGCQLKCKKTIYVTYLNGDLTLKQFYLCESRPRDLALGTNTPDSHYHCNKMSIEVVPTSGN